VVAADVEDEADASSLPWPRSPCEADLDHAIDEPLVGREAVPRLADFHPKRQAEAIDIADLRMAALQLPQAVPGNARPCPSPSRRSPVSASIFMVSSPTAVPSGLDAKVECVEAGREDAVADQRLLRPESARAVEAVRERLAEHEESGVTPKCSIAHSLPVRKKPIWYLVDHQQDAVRSSTRFSRAKKFGGGMT
jgi:hypothetical protein